MQRHETETTGTVMTREKLAEKFKELKQKTTDFKNSRFLEILVTNTKGEPFDSPLDRERANALPDVSMLESLPPKDHSKPDVHSLQAMQVLGAPKSPLNALVQSCWAAVALLTPDKRRRTIQLTDALHHLNDSSPENVAGEAQQHGKDYQPQLISHGETIARSLEKLRHDYIDRREDNLSNILETSDVYRLFSKELTTLEAQAIQLKGLIEHYLSGQEITMCRDEWTDEQHAECLTRQIQLWVKSYLPNTELEKAFLDNVMAFLNEKLPSSTEKQQKIAIEIQRLRQLMAAANFLVQITLTGLVSHHRILGSAADVIHGLELRQHTMQDLHDMLPQIIETYKTQLSKVRLSDELLEEAGILCTATHEEEGKPIIPHQLALLTYNSAEGRSETKRIYGEILDDLVSRREEVLAMTALTYEIDKQNASMMDEKIVDRMTRITSISPQPTPDGLCTGSDGSTSDSNASSPERVNPGAAGSATFATSATNGAATSDTSPPAKPAGSIPGATPGSDGDR